MNINCGQIAPVVISICIIILVAVLRAYSKTLAAITATVPINIMLALWIIHAPEGGKPSTTVLGSMAIGVTATLICVVGMWLAARAGWRLLPVIVAGYLTWVAALLVSYGLGRVFVR